MITESSYSKQVQRPEGVYMYVRRTKEYAFKSAENLKLDINKWEPISEYKFRKAIREERQEWKSSTEAY